MKQKDILTIVAVAIVAGIFSIIASKSLFVTPANRQQSVEVAPAIDTSFQQPDRAYFNETAIDPTELIQIGDNNNSAPFNGGNQ